MPVSRGPKTRASVGGDPSIISDLYIDDAVVVPIAAPSVKSPGAKRTKAATAALRAAGVEGPRQEKARRRARREGVGLRFLPPCRGR